MDVEGAEEVAHPVRALVGRAQALGPPGRRPARALVGDQLDWAHLVKADDRAVGGRLSVEREYALGLLPKVGIGAPLPRARALEAEPRLVEQRSQRGLRQDGGAGRFEVGAELGDRPARERDALVVGAGARERHDGVALGGRRLAGAPAPVVRVEGGKAALVELVDDLAHVRLVGHVEPGDLGRRHLGRRGEQDHRPDPLRAMLRAGRGALQPLGLGGREPAHEDLRGTHDHLQVRVHASRFDIGAGFPVKRLREGH